MKILWTGRALNDLKENIQYIAAKSPKNAEKVLQTLTSLVNTLNVFPYAYPIEPVYNKENVRFIVKWNYKIIYRIATNEIQILRIFNTKQHPSKI